MYPITDRLQNLSGIYYIVITSGSIKSGGFLYQLSYYQLLKKDSAPCALATLTIAEFRRMDTYGLYC